MLGDVEMAVAGAICELRALLGVMAEGYDLISEANLDPNVDMDGAAGDRTLRLLESRWQMLHHAAEALRCLDDASHPAARLSELDASQPLGRSASAG